MMISAWQKRRSDFNHDWLKNKYIPSLGTWMNILDGEFQDDDFEKSFLDEILPDFEYHKNEVIALANDFISEMTPRILFDEYPLSNLDNDTKDWLGDLVNYLWIQRYSVTNIVEIANTNSKAAIEAYDTLLELLNNSQDTRNIELLKSYRESFSNLLSACRSLSKAIEKLPSEVKVV